MDMCVKREDQAWSDSIQVPIAYEDPPSRAAEWAAEKYFNEDQGSDIIYVDVRSIRGVVSSWIVTVGRVPTYVARPRAG